MGDDVEHPQQAQQERGSQNQQAHNKNLSVISKTPSTLVQDLSRSVHIRRKKVREIGVWLIYVQMKMDDPGVDMPRFKAVFRHFDWDKNAIAEAWMTAVEDSSGIQSQALWNVFNMSMPTTTRTVTFGSGNPFATPPSSIASFAFTTSTPSSPLRESSAVPVIEKHSSAEPTNTSVAVPTTTDRIESQRGDLAENNKNPKAEARPLDEVFALESLAGELEEIITCITFNPWSEPDEKMPDEKFVMAPEYQED